MIMQIGIMTITDGIGGESPNGQTAKSKHCGGGGGGGGCNGGMFRATIPMTGGSMCSITKLVF